MSTDEFTPTTERVRAFYVAACDSPIAGMDALYRQDFDRWLAEHDEEIREAASQTIEDLTVKLVRTRIKLVRTRVELDAARATIRTERVVPKAERVSRDAIIAEVIDWLEWRAVIRFDEGELETEVDSHIMESLDAARKFFAIPVEADTYRNSYQKDQTE